MKCTFDLLQGKAKDKFRKDPRKGWYANVTDVTIKGDGEVTFHLKRPQPSLLAMLASGYTPIYPCHVPAAQMRTNPIGTGPFKFVEMKQNESIKLAKNPDYWKKGLPYLDGIEYTIIKNRATAVLAFVAGKVDMTFPTEMTAALEKDIKSQDPTAICEIKPINVSTNLIINRDSAAVQQSRTAQGDGAVARPQGVHRHHPAGAGRHRRLAAAAAGRRLGHAAGDAQDHSRLRRREEGSRSKRARS